MSPLHRLVAAVLALCVALFSLEAAVVDVHDTDGSPPRLISIDHADWHTGGGHHSDAPGDEHPVHVCHWAHGHTAGSVELVQTGIAQAPVLSFTPEWGSTQRPGTRVQEPLVPPPIA